MVPRIVSPLLAVSLRSLGACTPPSYTPGPGKSQAEYSPDAARCRLFARGTRPDTSFEAYGRPKDVAIATVAAAVVGGIGTVIHDNETFNDCMQANGWLVANGRAGNLAVTQPVVTSPTAPQQAAQPQPLNEREERAARAQRAAESWLIA